MIIKHILLRDYEFNINTESKIEEKSEDESEFSSMLGYGISYPDSNTLQNESEISVFLKLTLEFSKSDQELYTAVAIYQITMNETTIDRIRSRAFHLTALKEVYEKFSTLHNISVSQTPYKNAMISDDVLDGLEKEIQNHEIESN